MFTNHRKCQFSYMLVKTPSGEHLVAYAVCYPLNTFIKKYFSKSDSRHNKIMHSFWIAPSHRLRLRPRPHWIAVNAYTDTLSWIWPESKSGLQWRIHRAPGGHGLPQAVGPIFSHLVYTNNWLTMMTGTDQKSLNWYFNSYKDLACGDFVPRPHIKFQSSEKYLFSSFSIIEYGFYVNVGMISNEVVYLKCLLQICTNNAWMATSSAKKASCFWGLCPKDPLSSFIVLQQHSILLSYPIFTIDFVHECEQICTPSNHVVIYFKFLLQICTKMNGFKFHFSKTFTEPLRQTFPRFFSLAMSP